MKLRRSLLATLLTLSLVIAGCAGSGKISGHVSDTDAKPLVGAVVKTVSESDEYAETRTGADGSFSVEIPRGLPGDKLVGLMVWKQGYKTYLTQFTYVEASKQTDMKIVMTIGTDSK